MKLEDFLENLEIENTLLESGPDSILYHYTTLRGLIGILDRQIIRAYGYPYSNDNEVAVIRKSGDIKNINNIANNKNIIGYFKIEFHKLNDSVRKIRKKKINEPWIVYSKRIDKLLKKYNIKNVNDKTVKTLLSKDDYVLYNNLIHDSKLSLIKKEGEERIIGSIPINEKYMKFYFTKKNIKMNNKDKLTIDYYKSIMPGLFE